LEEVKKGDVVVFNIPIYSSLYDKFPDIYGFPLVKRCYGLPGDTVRINSKELSVRNESAQSQISGWESKKTKMVSFLEHFNDTLLHPDLFPHDSTLRWELDNYGPLFVPGKGKSIQLTVKNAIYYKDILRYEGYKTEVRGDSIYLNGICTSSYTFRENYYFMLGDNFYLSQDSRYWGFVPEKNIIGKVVLVLFSLDPDEPWYRKFRWKRFLKRVDCRK
jgi:signal peptidase I